MRNDNENLKLSQLIEEDLNTLLGWAEDEKTMLQWCGPVFDFPLTIDQLKEYFSESQTPAPKRILFKAVDENGIMKGMCELGSIDRRNGIASLCRIFVDKKYRGRGIAELMIRKLINIAFSELNVYRIELNVYTYNTPAFKCYEKLGFVREGMKRKVTKYYNEYWDGYFYALLKEDWKG